MVCIVERLLVLDRLPPDDTVKMDSLQRTGSTGRRLVDQRECCRHRL